MCLVNEPSVFHDNGLNITNQKLRVEYNAISLVKIMVIVVFLYDTFN